jgi:hypothetical protein
MSIKRDMFYRMLLPVLVLALLLGLSGVAAAQMGKGWFQVDSLRAEGNLLVEGNATVNGDLTLGSDLTAGDNVTVGNFLYLTAGTAISLTNGGIVTATNTYQPIDAAPSSTVTVTVAAGSSGQLLRLINRGTGTIVVADASTMVLASTYSMGQYDSLLLMSDGTNWIEMGRSNN